MADRFSEGWGQGLEPRGAGPALAINDSNAKFNISACPIHEHQASPEEQGQGKGKPSKGQGKGVKSSPGERKNPNLKPSEERAYVQLFDKLKVPGTTLSGCAACSGRNMSDMSPSLIQFLTFAAIAMLVKQVSDLPWAECPNIHKQD